MKQITLVSHDLSRTLISTDVPINVLEQLLSSKRSPNTRLAYKKDLNLFFEAMTGNPTPTSDEILEFLHLSRGQALSKILNYKSSMFQRGLKEATVNRRLFSIKALVSMGRTLGICDYSVEDIKSEPQKKYRDTAGITAETFQTILAQCDRDTIPGKRDYALLRLLWGNALRRNEICQLNISDFDPDAKTLRILGKGMGTQSEVIELGAATVGAIASWLGVIHGSTPNDPLFTALDNHSIGRRLQGDGLRKILVKRCDQAGIKKTMSPHRIRHSSITAALDATDGNIRKVQKLSRHKNINTLMIYDDNRGRDQGEITDLLDNLV